MANPSLPNDGSSLLVPIHLEAWVVDSFVTPTGLARFTANYGNLSNFQSPIPEPPAPPGDAPDDGVHLHWALPDALTHGRARPDGSGLEFPAVPNRWLVARFDCNGGAFEGKLWVVKSDNQEPLTLGKTAGEFTAQSTAIGIAAPGLAMPIGAQQKFNLIYSIENVPNLQTVVTSAAATTGATTLKVVQIPSLANNIAAGATVQVPTTSAFLDNKNATYADVVPGRSTKTVVNEKPIGTPFSIEAWEAHEDPGTDELFLGAVGPGNISFAAFAPFVENVFSFVDRDLPQQLANKYKYTYTVVGWYSNPNPDPLKASVNYDNLPQFWKDLWADRPAWEKQTPVERFQTLLSHLQWSASNVTTPPTSSLYHATLPGVLWAYDPALAGPPVDSRNVQVAVGNSPIDALSALVAADNDNPAGKELAELLQAAQYDLLKDYGQPGGQALIEQQIHLAWYGSNPGGILWEVVGKSPDDSGQAAQPPRLTPAQAKALDKALASLNTEQRATDQAQRELASLQSDLYVMWWKVGIANSGQGFGDQYDPGTFYPVDNTPQWKDLKPNLNKEIYPDLFLTVWKKYCAVQTALSKLPDPTDAASAQAWADKNWQFPGTSTEENADVNLSALGLRLKSTPMPRYWHPNDPVVLIRGLNRSRKHGEDGRESDDDTLRCRLPGEMITGLKIDGQPAIDVKTVTAGGVNLDPLGSVTGIPGIANLIHETFFVDPANAAIIATAVKGDEPKIAAAITAQNSWEGTPPVSFAITPWEQAWSPLFLEWSVTYFPTGKGQAENRQFQLDDWQFDGQRYTYTGHVATTDPNTGVETGSGFDPAYSVEFVGRVFVTPQSSVTLRKNIGTYLKNHPKIDSAQLDALLKDVGEWDLLTQSLSGFNDGLLSLNSDATFPPPPASDKVSCPPGQTPPSVTALVENQYHGVPVLVATEDPRFGGGRNHFYPVRGGFIQFQTLRVIDAFGQSYPITLESGSEPIPAQGLAPFTAPKGLPLGAIQLPPRVVQPSRFDFRWLANDNTGTDIEVSDNPNAICGWLLPNHLDGGISVYDSDGQPLGELYPPPYGWSPRPGAPGNNPPPPTIDGIKNVALQNVLKSIYTASQANAEVFSDLLQIIDETLWMVDPLGGRKDQMLSVLIGRPLAVVQARLQLDWYGNPAFNQLWQKMLKPKNYVKGQNASPPWERVEDIGGISDISFPVRLGNLQLLNDGLLGYYLPVPASGQPYGVFYSVHKSAEIEPTDTYIKQIRKPDQQAPTGWTYQGDLTLKFPQPQAGDPVTYKSDPVTVTMLVDPRGVVHASTGILPTTSVALPGHRIEDFLKKLAVTFRTGPIIADPGPLRTPQPAESRGSWTWIQRSSPTTWEEDTIVDADDRARMPDGQLQLREGWLKLTE